MAPAHPFEAFSRPALRLTALSSSAGSLALGGLLLVMGAPLVTADAPHGLASFELAGTAPRLAAVLAGWGGPGAEVARAMTLVDFPFLACYAASLGSLSLLVPGARRFPTAARAAAWASSAAALCDVLENLLSLRLLAGAGWGVGAMALLAAVKFALAGLALLWIVVALFISGLRD